MDKIEEKLFIIPDRIDPLYIYGNHDSNLKVIEKELDVRLAGRGRQIKIYGQQTQIDFVEIVLEDLAQAAAKGRFLQPSDLETSINIARNKFTGASNEIPKSKTEGRFVVTMKNNVIRPKTEGQKELINTMGKKDIVFAIGPAGTGKTYLAVAMAVHYLRSGRVKKLVLVRPAVEAGESLGYLPGDYKEKIDPYLRPLYDSLEDMTPVDILKKYIDQGVIEILPLAYMRGRTLNNAFVILDEAQNTTFTQMKMFLTRLGKNSKAVINGDVTQIDLPSPKDSGLISGIRILKNISGIAFVMMKKEDVVRHQLVKDIIEAYDTFHIQKEKDGNFSKLENLDKNE